MLAEDDQLELCNRQDQLEHESVATLEMLTFLSAACAYEDSAAGGAVGLAGVVTGFVFVLEEAMGAEAFASLEEDSVAAEGAASCVSVTGTGLVSGAAAFDSVASDMMVAGMRNPNGWPAEGTHLANASNRPPIKCAAFAGSSKCIVSDS